LAATVCYTLDGPGANQIDVETFSADVAVITVQGVNIHPSIAKDRMVNAIRVAAAFVDALPKDERSPETTAEREGFLHPYVSEGGVAEATVRVLLRDFDVSGLKAHAELLRSTARQTEASFPGCQIDVEIRRQYRNLGDGLKTEPRAVALAEQAHANLGRTAVKSIIRGGTDGSLLTEKGLPTPNLSTGQHNPHSPLEWACLDEMSQAVQVLIELVQLWGRERLE
jgi:tripeptide aminopeptidase